jgi:hypothetical protein
MVDSYLRGFRAGSHHEKCEIFPLLDWRIWLGLSNDFREHAIDDSCTLYRARRFVIESQLRMKRTLLAVGIAVLISTLCVPCCNIRTLGVPFFMNIASAYTGEDSFCRPFFSLLPLL